MIVVVDSGLGNLGSIVNMLTKLGIEAKRSRVPEEIAAADRLILPGVGAFDTGMQRLADLGLREVLDQQVLEAHKPVLGICLGMQLLTRRSEEGTLPGLGWIPADTRRFSHGPESRLRLPHMGWNVVEPSPGAPLFEAGVGEERFYFVHTFHAVCDDEADVLCWTDYGYRFASGIRHGNVAGVQFHPEKSHKFGMRLLGHFAQWEPAC